MEVDLNERLRQNNDRFLTAISSIVERYNQPFEDDLLISMETLTYETVDGPVPLEQLSTKKIKKWKRTVFKCKRRINKNAEMSKQEPSNFEDGHSTVQQESPEISAMETSDIDEENGTIVAVARRKYEGVYSQNLYERDGKIPETVKVDPIVQDHARRIPEWMMNPYGHNGKTLEMVKVDPIVQDHARRIPEWMMVAPRASSKDLPLALPVQELSDNQAAVCRRKELPNECSSSRSLESQFPNIPISPYTLTIPRHPPYPELHETCCDSILEDDHSGAKECSWSNLTLADLYPAMVEIFKRHMTKHSQKKVLKYMFGHLRCKKWHSRRLKLKVIVDKRGFRPLKQALPSVCSCRSEDSQNQTLQSEDRELCGCNCSINDFSALVPCSSICTSGDREDCCDSTLEQHLIFGKGQEASKQPFCLDNIVTMGETFPVEDKLQAASLESAKCKQRENLAYKCSSECSFIASAASSGSTVVHLVNKINTQPDLPCRDTSELSSSPYSCYGNRNTSTCFTNCYLTRTSNTLLINPEKVISNRKKSFPSLSMKQRPSETAQKYEDAFEKLYYELCSKEIPKPLMLTRPHSNSENLEEKGRLVKSNFSVSRKSATQFDIAFDRIYEQLCSEPIPKLPGLQRFLTASGYEGIQVSETVSALVNSPVRASSQLFGVKRQRNFESYLALPVKRLRDVPECFFPSPKRQQASHGGNNDMRTVCMDLLSTDNSSKPISSASHTCQSQHSAFQVPSDRIPLCLPGPSTQGAHCGWPKAKKY
ncbi:Holliday junction recognition protein isoform X2 [Pogoniulus pusillus]|uniref:Holliday junction recognition protein isoform X2 n=1 Tax=Pogoniulus pusillus TaxID=488313 RepID=UPI0030B955AB